MKRFVLIICSVLFAFACLAAEQCKGTTQAGARCKKRTSDAGGYCTLHRQTKSSTEQKDAAVKTSAAKATFSQCTAATKKGERCKRKAAAGSDKCWQHK